MKPDKWHYENANTKSKNEENSTRETLRLLQQINSKWGEKRRERRPLKSFKKHNQIITCWSCLDHDLNKPTMGKHWNVNSNYIFYSKKLLKCWCDNGITVGFFRSHVCKIHTENFTDEMAWHLGLFQNNSGEEPRNKNGHELMTVAKKWWLHYVEVHCLLLYWIFP